MKCPKCEKGVLIVLHSGAYVCNYCNYTQPEPTVDTNETKIAENQAKYNNYVKTTTTNMDERHANEFSRPIIE